MRKIGFLLVIILTLNSCATILNSKHTTVKVSADNASEIIFNNDTIVINKKQIKIRPLRSNKPLKITVLKDSLKKDFYFKKKISGTYFLNIHNYGVGCIVDLFNHKRFRYKHNLHFITDSVSKNITLSNKKVTVVPKNKLFIYTSPLKSLDFFSIPMLTIGVEYLMINNFSISAEYGTLFPNTKLQDHKISYLKEKASEYRFEVKWYNGINLTENVHLNEYLGIEFREIQSQYNNYLDYVDKNDTSQNLITDDFATKKRVTILNLKYGILMPIGKRFYFDFYTGLGLRIKRFNHINLEYNDDLHQINYDDFFFFDFRSSRFENYDKKNLFNISLGFKFGINL